MNKIIHYVWLGGQEKPSSVISCINTWRRLCPDWKIIEWNENNFPINNFRWVKEAILVKKYAFAADFIRLWALYQYGGAYCDTDVTFVKSLNKVVKTGFVCSVENFLIGTETLKYLCENGTDSRTGKSTNMFGIQAGCMYSDFQHPFIKQCIENIYDNGQRRFIKEDGSFERIVIDGVMCAELVKLGFKFKDTVQYLEPKITIYDSSVFATKRSKTENSVAIHWFDQSWKSNDSFKWKFKTFIKRKFYKIIRR